MTMAYRFPFSPRVEAVIVNPINGRQPQAIVDVRDYNKVRDDIAARLKQVRDPYTAQPLVACVHRREDLYYGPKLELAPDLIAEFNGLWDGGGLLGTVFSPVPRLQLAVQSRNHTLDGTVIVHGDGIRPGRIEGAKIEDVAPTIFDLLGLKHDGLFDGKSLLDGGSG